MTDGYFFPLIVISVFAYGTHGALLVGSARSRDSLIVSAYRGLSLSITMLPVLFFATKEEIFEILEHIPTLLLASSTGAFAFICAFAAARYLPVGVSTSVRQVVNVFAIVVLGAIFLQEYLSMLQFGLLGGIVACGVALTLLRTDHSHLDPKKVGLGLWYCVCAGLGAAVTHYFFSILSREVNPFVASYFWEATIGIFSLGYLIFLIVAGKYTDSPWLPISEAVRIICISLLTIVATISLAFAVNHGPYSLAAGILSSTVVIWTAAGWFLYDEKPRASQVIFIGLTVLLMFLLRVVS